MAGNRHPLLLLEMGKECGNMPTIDITMRKAAAIRQLKIVCYRFRRLQRIFWKTQKNGC